MRGPERSTASPSRSSLRTTLGGRPLGRATLGRAARALLGRAAVLAVVVCGASGPALAHGGSLGGAAGTSLTAPAWLVAATGGVAVGASLLAGSIRGPVAERVGAPGLRVRLPAGRVLRTAGRFLGVVGLVGVVAVGLFGPADPLSNAATLVVWVGWWAGYAMTTYLVGNSWPVVDPWRTLSRALPDVGREYEWRYGAWASLAGLLALVWIEVVGPLADRPRTLAVTVLAYSAVTLAGASVYGTGTWFGTVDPIAGVFRRLGQVAPVGADGRGRLSIGVPGSRLAEEGVVDGLDEVAFVVAVFWAITYDGLVTTPLWKATATALVRTGAPPPAVYALGLCAGYLLFLGLYLLAVRAGERIGGPGVEPETLAERFAPPFLAVAAGAHVVHFAGYFLALTPPLLAAVSAPLDPVSAPVVVVPDPVVIAAVGAVAVGHVVGLRAVRSVARDLGSDPGAGVPARTGLPFVALLTVYTLVTLWIVTSPEVAPPFV